MSITPVYPDPIDSLVGIDETEWQAGMEVTGQVNFPLVASPAPPASGEFGLIGQADAGRTVPAFVSQDGVAHGLQSALSRGHIFMNLATNNATAMVNIGTPGLTATGTATSSNVFGATTLWGYTPLVEFLVTVAATNAVAGFRLGSGRVVTVGGPGAGLGGFSSVLIWGPATGVATATYRAAAGMTSTGGAPTDVEPSTMTNCVMMGWDAADTNIQIMHNDASGTCTKVDLGASFPVPTVDRTHLYEMALFSHKGTTQSVEWRVKNILTGAIASGTITTNLPSTSEFLGMYGYAAAGGTSSVVGIALSSNYIDPLLD